MKKVKKMALGGMGAKTQSQLQASVPRTQSQLQASVPRTQSQMQNAAQGAFKSAGMNVPNLPKMTGPLGGVGKPPATPQTASLVKAYNAQKSGNMGVGSQAAKTGLGDTFKGVARPPTSLANLGSALRQLGAGRAMKKGGAVKSSASKRGDGIAQRGKTKGRMV